MKLSQAMRIGAKKSHQTTGQFWDGDGGTCALGAVLLGCGFVWNSNCLSMIQNFQASNVLAETFPEVRTQRASCPCCNLIMNKQLGLLIIHLNDHHSWSRERIAGWLESHIEVPTYSMLDMMEYMGTPLAMVAIR